MIAVTPPNIDHHRCAELSVPIRRDATIQTLCDLRISPSPLKPRLNNTSISNERISKAHDSNVMAHTVERPSPANLSIGSCLTVPQNSAIPLHFNPSLNYLAVIGGGSNSRHRGRFNEFEFQKNALNHLWWLITALEEFYQAYALGAQDRQAYESAFRILIKCHCVDQLFNTPSDKSNSTADNASVLLQELQNTGNLLLHARDQTHAFYLEILGQPKHCDVHIYNTGKGLVHHHRKAIVNNKGERKMKYYTRRTFHGIEMTTERLSRLIANMSQISFRLLPRIPIYKLYFLLGSWQANAVRPSV